MTDDPLVAIVEAWARERPDLDTFPLLVVGRIARLEAETDRLLRPPFAEAGLASGDFDLLAALRRAGAPWTLTPTALAASMLVSRGTTTKRVDRLSRQGLVERIDSADDGRSLPVRLTRAGRVLVDRLIGVHLANEARLLAGLTPAKQRRLAGLLAELHASLPDQ